jgi:zinc/manganese transport system permease protein
MSIWDRLFDFSEYGELIAWFHNSLIAGALLGLAGGLIGVFVVMRDLTFAVHGISELTFAGAAFAQLIGVNVVVGSVVGSLLAALLFGLLGVRARERSSIIGVLMPFGLGLGVLFLSLYPGRAANKFGLLTGQIVSIDDPALIWITVITIVVLAALAILWRPLMFATVDPEIAAARGVPVRALSPIFMIVLGLTVAMSVKTIGALLVLALLVTPAAAAMRVTASALWVPVLSMGFAVVSMVGGILLALGGTLPISPFITTISFAIYVVCRLVGRARVRRGWTARRTARSPSPPHGSTSQAGTNVAAL